MTKLIDDNSSNIPLWLSHVKWFLAEEISEDLYKRFLLILTECKLSSEDIDKIKPLFILEVLKLAEKSFDPFRTSIRLESIKNLISSYKSQDYLDKEKIIYSSETGEDFSHKSVGYTMSFAADDITFCYVPPDHTPIAGRYANACFASKVYMDQLEVFTKILISYLEKE